MLLEEAAETLKTDIFKFDFAMVQQESIMQDHIKEMKSLMNTLTTDYFSFMEGFVRLV